MTETPAVEDRSQTRDLPCPGISRGHCSHSRRAETLRVQRLKSPSNKSGPDKVPITREFQHSSPGHESGTVPSSFQAAPLRKQRVQTCGELPQYPGDRPVSPGCRGRAGGPRPGHSGLQAKVQPSTLVQVTGIDAQCLFSPSHHVS